MYSIGLSRADMDIRLVSMPCFERSKKRRYDTFLIIRSDGVSCGDRRDSISAPIGADDKDRKDIEADLLVRALQSAKDQADKLAQPLGRHVGAAVAVSKLPFDSIASSFGQGGVASIAVSAMRAFKKSAMPDALLVPSTISLSASVNVLFKMD